LLGHAAQLPPLTLHWIADTPDGPLSPLFCTFSVVGFHVPLLNPLRLRLGAFGACVSRWIVTVLLFALTFPALSIARATIVVPCPRLATLLGHAVQLPPLMLHW
jgi:hypothetical protein